MYKYELEVWWKFKEVLDARDSGDNKPWNLEKTFFDEFYNDYTNAPLWKSDSAAKDYLEELYSLVFARYYEDLCVKTPYNFELDEDSQVLDVDTIDRFITNFINIIVLTYPKYSTLLSVYQSKEGKLLDQINSMQSGVARFNDTPQNSESDDEFENDNHVTNITKTSASNTTDGMTPIERLKQIQDGYKSVMRDWSNEFRVLFIDEANLSL